MGVNLEKRLSQVLGREIEIPLSQLLSPTLTLSNLLEIIEDKTEK